MTTIQGEILTENGLQKGKIKLEENKTITYEQGILPQPTLKQGLIVPSFINAHTHIGDTFIKTQSIKLPTNVKQLVAPPNGLKHQLLQTTSEKEIIKGMKHTIQEMIHTHHSGFSDFREQGQQGLHQLHTALNNQNIHAFILSRPNQMNYHKQEIDQLLKHSQGMGLSSISDYEHSELLKIAKHVKRKHKTFAIHASETIREDIDTILDLHPDFLIHMIQATPSDLQRTKDENIPIVICPRSNAYFHLPTNMKQMKKINITLMLGTDNAMLNSPNVLEELHFLKKTSTIFTKEELLQMITLTPRKALNWDDPIQGSNRFTKMVVLDKKSLQPLYTITDRGGKI